MLLGAPAAARADGWLDRSLGRAFELAEVRIPEGALPPGTAEAEIVGGAVSFDGFRQRFTMPRHGDATVRLWFQWGGPTGDGTSVVVEARGGGARFRQSIPIDDLRQRNQSQSSALFLGEADALGELVAAVRARGAAPTEAESIVTDIRLDRSEHALAQGCRALARAAVVVVDRPAQTAPFVRCAALGARVVLVTPTLPESLRGIATAEGTGRAAPWGAGLVAWAPTLDDAARAALDVTSGAPTAPATFSSRVTNHLGLGMPSDEHAAGEVSHLAVLGLIAGYVLVLGPLGWLVLRRRNTLLSWAYFPGVAVLATALLGVVTLGTDERADRVLLDRTVLASPDGLGIELVALRVLGVQTRSYRIRASYRDADLVSMGQPFRFGSPFTKPAGSLALLHDARRDTVEVTGLAVSRWSEAGVSWAAPRTVAVPRLERDAQGGLILVAPSDVPSRAALVATSAGTALVRGLAAGERRAIHLSDDRELPERLQRLGGAWPTWIDLTIQDELAPPGAAVIVVEPSPTRAAGLRVTPRVSTEQRGQRIVLGVAP